MGAVIAETVAELASSSLMGSVETSAQETAEAAGRTEVLPEDYESVLSQNQEISASIGRFVSGATAVLTNQDVEVARQTSNNAVENNFLLTAAVIVGTVAFEMWKDANPEAWASFKQSALEEITDITGLSESQVESGLKNAGVAYDVYNAISGKGLMKIGTAQMARQAPLNSSISDINANNSGVIFIVSTLIIPDYTRLSTQIITRLYPIPLHPG